MALKVAVLVMPSGSLMPVTPVSGLKEAQAQAYANTYAKDGQETRLLSVSQWRAYARKHNAVGFTRRDR